MAKIAKAKIKNQKRGKEQVLGYGNKVYSMSSSELKPIISALGSHTKRQLQHLEKAGVLESSPAAQHLLGELKKIGITDWRKRGALSASKLSLGQQKQLYSLYSGFFGTKTSKPKAAKQLKEKVETITGSSRYKFKSDDEEKRYKANFWFMYHKLQEDYEGVFNSLMTYKGNKLLESDNVKSIPEVLSSVKGNDLKNYGTNKNLKQLLLSFDSRDTDFTSDNIPEEVNRVFREVIEDKYRDYI